MFSSRNRPTVGPWALALLLTALTGCGHKKLPQPPPLMVPAQTDRLVVEQRGPELVVRLPYPRTTVGGAALPDLLKLELWEVRREIDEASLLLLEGSDDTGDESETTGEELSEESELASPEESSGTDDDTPPATEEASEGSESDTDDEDEEEESALERQQPRAEDLLAIAPRDFARAATLLRSFTGDELDALVVGEDLVLRLPVGEFPQVGLEGRIFAVKTFSHKGLESALSNLFPIVPREEPPSPAQVELDADEEGVHLRWSWEGDEPKVFRVYRREATERDFDRHLAEVPADEREYTDARVALGGRFIYSVSAVAQRNPVVESATRSEREVYYIDRFAPETPTAVVAFAEPGQVRIVWDPPEAEDTAGYLLFRRSEDGELQPLSAELIVHTEYVDETVQPGEVWAYSVIAVDENGNRSVASEESRVRVP